MKPILRDFPDTFETERLTIRSPRPGDGPELNAALRESWAELKPWMVWAKEDPPSLAASEARVRTAYSNFITRKDLTLHLYLKGTDTLVGSSGLHRFEWSVPRFEIGYWVRTRFAGRGYITEAVAGITDFAFGVLDAERVEIHCAHNNQRSAAIPRRLGYRHEGTLRAYRRHHLTNELVDQMVFAVLKEEWPGRAL